MFERLFGAKKEKIEGVNSDKNSVEGVAHFDGTKTEIDLFQDKYGHLQDVFDENKLNQKISNIKERDIRENWKEESMKVSNERNHPKLGEEHSDWKGMEQSSPTDSTIYGKVEDPDLAELMQDEEDKKFIREFYDEEGDYEDEDHKRAA